MFRTEKFSAFLQGVKWSGTAEKKLIELVIYITPITFELAAEVSEKIADRLFRRGEDGKWAPALEMPTAAFNAGTIPVQTMTIFPVNDQETGDPALTETLGTMLQNVNVSGFHALQLIPAKPDLTLAFRATTALDKLTAELAIRFYRKKIFLTFAAMQGELPLDNKQNTVAGEALCEECGNLAFVVDQEGATFCRKHVRAAAGEIRELHPERRETPKQAEQRVLKEALDGPAPADGSDPHIGAQIGEPGGPPAVEEANLGEDEFPSGLAAAHDAEFINARNRGRKKKRVH